MYLLSVGGWRFDQRGERVGWIGRECAKLNEKVEDCLKDVDYVAEVVIWNERVVC